MEQFLSVGQIINTHGVKGELKVYPLTDDVKRFRKLKKVYIDNEERTIIWCKIMPKVVIIKIEGIETLEEAFSLKQKYLKVKREEAVTLKKDSYFVADIVGSRVIDENDKELGCVDEVIFTGSNDVYWIKGENELLIPAIKTVVVKVDIEEKLIVIKPVDVWS